jgi:hypothetical protein
MAWGQTVFYRWGGAAKPGKWIAAMSFAVGSQRVCTDCAIDDFGNLVPVSAAGMTATGFVEHREFRR